MVTGRKDLPVRHSPSPPPGAQPDSIGQPGASSPLLDLRTVADRLGVKPRHVRRLVSERRIPFLKWGRLLRFDAAELDSWLDQARVPTNGGRPPAAQNHGSGEEWRLVRTQGP
jgi:excisionase family DNA binding protein